MLDDARSTFWNLDPNGSCSLDIPAGHISGVQKTWAGSNNRSRRLRVTYAPGCSCSISSCLDRFLRITRTSSWYLRAKRTLGKLCLFLCQMLPHHIGPSLGLSFRSAREKSFSNLNPILILNQALGCRGSTADPYRRYAATMASLLSYPQSLKNAKRSDGLLMQFAIVFGLDKSHLLCMSTCHPCWSIPSRYIRSSRWRQTTAIVMIFVAYILLITSAYITVSNTNTVQVDLEPHSRWCIFFAFEQSSCFLQQWTDQIP